MKTSSKILLLFLGGIMIAALTAIFMTILFSVKIADVSSSTIAGNGKIVTQAYSFAEQPFTAIELGSGGDMKVQVTHQPNTTNATITTNSDLLQHIKVYVQGKTLYIGKRSYMDFYPLKKIKITVNIENLTSITTRGSGNIQVDKIKTNDFSVAIHGSGNTVLQGEAKDLAIKISGSGKINTKQLSAQEVKAVIHGSGNILTNAAQKINAEINGSGRIEYYGKPAQVEQTIHGSGTIRALR